MRDRNETHDAVRHLLEKMKVHYVELENNRERADYCGNSLYRPQVERNPKLAPKHYKDGAEVTGYEPPTYSAVGTSDGIANWRTMKSRLDTMSGMGIPTEFHSYDGLPHGFGLGTGTVAEGWINDAVAFWEGQM